MKSNKINIYNCFIIFVIVISLFEIYSDLSDISKKLISAFYLDMIKDDENEIKTAVSKDGSKFSKRINPYATPKDFKIARDLNDSAIKRLSSDQWSELYKELSTIYFKRELYLESLYYIDKSIENDSLCHTCYSLRGLANMHMNDMQQALKDFETSLLIKKEPATYFNRHLLYSKLGLTKIAFEDLKSSFEIDKNYYKSQFFLIPYYLNSNKIEVSKDILENIKTNINISIKTYFAEAAINLAEKNITNSNELLKKAIELLNNHDKYKMDADEYAIIHSYFSYIVLNLQKIKKYELANKYLSHAIYFNNKFTKPKNELKRIRELFIIE